MSSVAHEALIERLAARTIRLIEREYPNGLVLKLDGPWPGPLTPSGLYPAFYGCFDWHSSVHSHWQVVRAIRACPSGSFVGAATDVLDRTLTPANIAGEMASLADRPTFEMPYGMAWLLRLCRELRDRDDERSRRWLAALTPLEAHAVERFDRYCRRLTRPQRGGMHNQTAFALGLVWDSAPSIRPLVGATARRLFGDDTDVDLRFEPSAADFLSAALSESDLMRRVLPGDEFVDWLEAFAPGGFDALEPVQVIDPTDGQLAHWAGLNLSRSWMMSSIVAALPHGHRFTEALTSNAERHAEAGLAMADHEAYMVSHWVPTFAVYLLTES